MVKRLLSLLISLSLTIGMFFLNGIISFVSANTSINADDFAIQVSEMISEYDISLKNIDCVILGLKNNMVHSSGWHHSVQIQYYQLSSSPSASVATDAPDVLSTIFFIEFSVCDCLSLPVEVLVELPICVDVIVTARIIVFNASRL